jgi:hypothetical protein
MCNRVCHLSHIIYHRPPTVKPGAPLARIFKVWHPRALSLFRVSHVSQTWQHLLPTENRSHRCRSSTRSDRHSGLADSETPRPLINKSIAGIVRPAKGLPLRGHSNFVLQRSGFLPRGLSGRNRLTRSASLPIITAPGLAAIPAGGMAMNGPSADPPGTRRPESLLGRTVNPGPRVDVPAYGAGVD